MRTTTVTLEQVLEAREERVRRQKALLEKHGLPVLSFTMNSPGAVKDSPLIRRVFFSQLARLKEMLGASLRESEVCLYPAGPHFLASVDMDAAALKRRCVELEESTPAGRLLDLDVIGADGRALSRTALGHAERPCLVCGKPGRVCAAGQLHSYEELAQAAESRMVAYISEQDAKTLAGWATDALIREVHVTPKPGLVDERNNGSHRDMDLPLMEKSARSLTPYFERCVRIGMETGWRDAAETFPPLRQAGLEAEKAMFAATNGVNTHKGAVYLFGILLGALGRRWNAEAWPSPDAVLDEAGDVAREAVQRDLAEIARLPKDGLTAGQRLYRERGLTGARGEAAASFPALRETALPYLKEHRGEKEAPARVLLRLIARGTDTNLYARGGTAGADEAVQAVRDLLARGEPGAEDMEKLDEAFIKKNLSPGGSADLLAAALFCERLNEETEKETTC